jgi:hypothetical protein
MLTPKEDLEKLTIPDLVERHMSLQAKTVHLEEKIAELSEELKEIRAQRDCR